MTLDEIDIALSDWAERLRRIDDNLIALESDSTYQVLVSVAGKGDGLTGVTAARVKPALDTLAELFEARGKLTDVLDRARAIRATISGLSFWDNADKEAQIERLLLHRSIFMRTTQTPLAARALLDVAQHEESVSPGELVMMMVNAFNVARDSVLAVSAAWASLEPQLERIERELTNLKSAAATLGKGAAVAELAPIEQEIARLREQIARDPLGVSGSVAQSIEPRVAAARGKILAELAAFDRAMLALAEIDARRAELIALNARARDALLRAPRELSPTPSLGVPVSAGEVDGIDAWTAKLRATVGEGRTGPAVIGAERLLGTLRGYIAKDLAVTSALDLALAERSELLGRLSARRAQLSALAARGGTIDPAVLALAERAESALRARPTDLALARRLANEAEHAITEIASRTRQ